MILVFATHNKHKAEEVVRVLPDSVRLVRLSELNCNEDIPETGNTLKENALQKVSYVYEHYGVNCFADDTGLEIDAIGGRPGVYSARYAGEACSFEDNIRKVLSEMKNIGDMSKRTARFRTVVALILDGREYFFEACVEGCIIKEKRGRGGFGYDPIFMPEGYDQTFAEMDVEEKNRISHRGIAMGKLTDFLSGYK